MLDHTHIAVLESKWFKNSNISMRNLFELIADIATGNPNHFHYEMAGSPDSAAEAIPRIAKYRNCRYLCIGTHGDEKGLEFLNGQILSRTRLRGILTTVEETNGARLDGVYLSSCAFGTQELADFLLPEVSRPVWISGYTCYVNWIESSALDLLFFNELMRYEDGEDSPLMRITRVADKLMSLAPDLINHLGFGIYVRKKGYSGGAKNILQKNGDESQW